MKLEKGNFKSTIHTNTQREERENVKSFSHHCKKNEKLKNVSNKKTIAPIAMIDSNRDLEDIYIERERESERKRERGAD